MANRWWQGVGRGSAIFGLLLMAAAALATLAVARQRDLSPLENTMFQLATLAGGLFGSFLFGKFTAKEAAVDMMKPAARGSFRRLLSLLEGLITLRALMKDKNSDGYTLKERHKVATALVTEHVRTTYQCLEDWGELVPDELADLRAKISAVEDEPV